MRTTVRLDDQLLNELPRLALKEGVSLTRLMNRVVRRGLESLVASSARPKKPFRQRTYAMGKPKLPLDKESSLAASLEDEETIKKLTRQREVD